MNDLIWKEISNLLQHGAREKGHPCRYCTMATIGLDLVPRLRTVVLRRASDNLDLSIYTDRRSKKVLHIMENNRTSLLFYHPDKQIQIKVEGLAYISTDQKVLEEHWQSIHPEGQREYTASQAPGSDILDPNTLEYLNESNFFCLIEIEPFKIEYLKLQRPHHLRIRFSKMEDLWKSDYLVP